MGRFYELDVNLKTLCLTLLFLLNLCQFGYLILLFYFQERRRTVLNILPTLSVFALLTVLAAGMYGGSGFVSNLPAWIPALLWPALTGYTIAAIVRQLNRGRETLTPGSVKEAVDQLPDGLAYFTETGLMVLCNTKMQEIIFQLTGHDLQMQGELEGLLQDSAVLTLPDGTVQSFEKSRVQVGPSRTYVQYTASDLTELYELREQIVRDNEKMQVMIRQVQDITENVAEITRQEEILSAKMRVHNKMGNCMLAVRQYLQAETPHSPEDKEQLIRLWEENLAELQGEVGASDTRDAYETVVQIAETLGLEIVLHGTLPKNRKSAYLLVVALRECVTNAINHAGAKRLDMTVSKAGPNITASYTNDGMQPGGRITEGGGLSSLRARIEGAGGEMKVLEQPTFILSVTIPASVDEGAVTETLKQRGEKCADKCTDCG